MNIFDRIKDKNSDEIRTIMQDDWLRTGIIANLLNDYIEENKEEFSEAVKKCVEGGTVNSCRPMANIILKIIKSDISKFKTRSIGDYENTE